MADIIRYSPHLGTNIGFIVWPIDPNHEIFKLYETIKPCMQVDLDYDLWHCRQSTKKCSGHFYITYTFESIII